MENDEIEAAFAARLAAEEGAPKDVVRLKAASDALWNRVVEKVNQKSTYATRVDVLSALNDRYRQFKRDRSRFSRGRMGTIRPENPR